MYFPFAGSAGELRQEILYKKVYQSIANTRANALFISCMVISESFPNC